MYIYIDIDIYIYISIYKLTILINIIGKRQP